MIEVRSVHRRFGRVEAVRGVSFSAERGQVVGLLGPNGAGKTTTIRIITGYLPPTSGRVLVDGLDSVDDTRSVRRRLGYLPESTPLYPEMRVCDYLHHRGRLYGLRRRERTASVARSIERCWLTEMRERRTGELSKGYRQRVGLAAAMLHDPPALILDEPTSGLDPAQIVEMRSLVRELGSDKTMLISSHILPEVEATCDRVVMIARGEVRADGTLQELAHGRRGRAPIHMEVKASGSVEDTARPLRAAAGVESLEAEAIDGGEWVRIAAQPREAAGDLRESLARAAKEAGLLVREIRRNAVSLEQLFIELTSDAPAADAPAEAAS